MESWNCQHHSHGKNTKRLLVSVFGFSFSAGECSCSALATMLHKLKHFVSLSSVRLFDDNQELSTFSDSLSLSLSPNHIADDSSKVRQPNILTANEIIHFKWMICLDVGVFSQANGVLTDSTFHQASKRQTIFFVRFWCKVYAMSALSPNPNGINTILAEWLEC